MTIESGEHTFSGATGRLDSGLPKGDKTQELGEFLGKDNVNIVVLDSGVGGISVAADLYERTKRSGIFAAANITFFNAKPHPTTGYNSLGTDKEKILTFDQVLQSMGNRLEPDLLLLACNTLSVLYPKTAHSSSTAYPVVGIVETGVNLIKKSLEEQQHSDVFIFGTETTIEQGTHKNILTDQGVAVDRIHTKACPGLTLAIENDPHDSVTTSLIDQYVSEAVEGYTQNGNTLFTSLNCTHYGYSSDVFRDAFAHKGIENVSILDPNPYMADFMFDSRRPTRFQGTNVSISFASYASWDPENSPSIRRIISSVSPETAATMITH